MRRGGNSARKDALGLLSSASQGKLGCPTRSLTSSAWRLRWSPEKGCVGKTSWRWRRDPDIQISRILKAEHLRYDITQSTTSRPLANHADLPQSASSTLEKCSKSCCKWARRGHHPAFGRHHYTWWQDRRGTALLWRLLGFKSADGTRSVSCATYARLYAGTAR